VVSAARAGDAGDESTSSSKIFLAKLIKFGWIWKKLRQNLEKIEAKFGEND